MEEKTQRLAAGLANAAQKAQILATVRHIGSMLGIFFSDREVKNFDDAKACDLEIFAQFYIGMRENGIYIAPSQFEALFISAAHEAQHIDATIRAAEIVLSKLRKKE